MRRLDRAGIFRARPLSWFVRRSESSEAVAISMEFHVVEQLEGSEWKSWSAYEEHAVYGDFYVVKKDGTINTTVVEQLVRALGWSGDLRDLSEPVPDAVVQITVKGEEYNGQTRFKAGWLNPGDYVPRPTGASDDDVTVLQARFGSLLRAAAAAAMEAAKPKAAPLASKPAPAATTADVRCPISDEPLDAPDDGVPF